MITRRQFGLGLGTGILGGVAGRVDASGLPDGWSESLTREIVRIEAGLVARLGVAVLDTGTGRRASHRGGERFPMCSTFKALACAAVLRRVDAGQEDLNRRVRFQAGDVVTYSPVTGSRAGRDGMTLAELCEAAMTRSDNTAANLILKSLGGPSGVTVFAHSLGDTITRLDRWETALNEAAPGDPRDTTTPDAMAANLQALVLGGALSKEARDRFTAWLVANRTGDEKLRAGLPKDWRVGDKTGGGAHGTMNDVAVIWPPRRAPLIVSVYMTETDASAEQRNAAMAEIGRMVQVAAGS